MIEKLKKHCKIISGYAFKSSDLQSEGEIPVIKIGNISNGNDIIIDDTTQYVNSSFYAIDKKYHINRGDILISLTGSHMNQPNSMVGRTCRSYHNRVFLLNQRAGKVICDKDTDINYIYYLLTTKAIKESIVNRAYGAANQANISPSDIMDIKWAFHSYTEQKKISAVLSAYDNLIEVNNKRIKVLEQMAENLYKEWFVRFRFPGHENAEFENGIPKGWKILKIGNIATIKAGGDRPEVYSEFPVEGITTPIYSNGLDNDGLYGFTDKAIISEQSITISARGTVGFVCLRRVPYVPIVRLIAIVPDTKEVIPIYLYYYLQRDSVIATGTSQQQITVPMVSRKRILVPPKALQEKLDEAEKPIWYEMDCLREKNNNLIKQRDLLLPCLMSGKLEV